MGYEFETLIRTDTDVYNFVGVSGMALRQRTDYPGTPDRGNLSATLIFSINVYDQV